MKTRAAVAHKAGAPLAIETVDLDGPRAGEVLVDVHAAGVNFPDLLVVTGPLGGSLASGRHLRPEPRFAEGAWFAACAGRVLIADEMGLVLHPREGADGAVVEHHHAAPDDGPVTHHAPLADGGEVPDQHLLPETHVAVVRADRIVAHYEDGFALARAELDAAGAEYESIARNLGDAVETLSDATSWIMTSGLADPKEALGQHGIRVTGYLDVQGLYSRPPRETPVEAWLIGLEEARPNP